MKQSLRLTIVWGAYVMAGGLSLFPLQGAPENLLAQEFSPEPPPSDPQTPPDQEGHEAQANRVETDAGEELEGEETGEGHQRPDDPTLKDQSPAQETPPQEAADTQDLTAQDLENVQAPEPAYTRPMHLSREVLTLLVGLQSLDGGDTSSPHTDTGKIQAALMASHLARLMESTQGTP